MNPKVSIVVMVDAVGALSDRTLHNGNLSLVDDSPLGSRHRGTPDLVTAVLPGQVVQWTPIHVDVQTPVEIHNIEFLTAGAPAERPAPPEPAVPGYAAPPDYTAPSDRPAPSGHAAEGVPLPHAPGPAPSALGSNGIENHDLLVWEGYVPHHMVPGVPYRYRLSVKLHDGPHSVLHIDSPALLRV
ncbi:hypothetical protein [Actinomadura kijaniata]|uniref:hypothetical protein n=1 Tax=Actinomadura kijaniata TaxID=46161 RepID=UPI00082F3C1A|nr:hypothetical protein [Actinomadura kijaniata]